MRRIAIVYCLVLALLGLAFAGFFVFFKLRGPRGEPPALSAKARSAENFWRWFSANEVALANAVRAQGATAAVDIVEKTSARLGRVCGPAVVGEVALPRLTR